jgi:hypothetical protein
MEEMTHNPSTKRAGRSRSSAKATSPRKKASKKPARAAASSSAPRAKKAATRKPSTKAKSAARPGVGLGVTPQERDRLIAEAAYLRAEKRGFGSGDAVEDWLHAEAEVDARLMEQSRRRRGQKPSR